MIAFPLSLSEERLIRRGTRLLPLVAGLIIVLLGAMTAA